MSSSTGALPRGFGGYVQLLKQNRDVRNVWIAQVISQMGDWFNSVAVLGLINRLTPDPMMPVLVTVFTVLPSALAGLTISGFIADRIDRKKLAISMDLVRALFALLPLLVHSQDTLWIAYASIIAMSLGESLFGPSIAAAQPNLCRPNELATANALQQSTWASMSLFGAYIGGLITLYFGPQVAFVLNGISFVGSAYFLARVVGSFGQGDRTRSASLSSLTEGFRWLQQHPRVFAISVVKPIWAITFGAVGLFSVYAYQIYGMGDAGTSWLYAARGIGSVAGPLLVQSYFPPHSPRDFSRILIVALVLGIIGYTVWAISPLPLIGMLGILIAHLGGGCNWTYSRMVVQRESPDHLRGRILSLDTVGFSFAAGVFSFLIGLVARNSTPMYGALSGVVVSAVLGVIWIAYLMRTIMHDDKLSTHTAH